jgi:hypothetical protein
MEVSRACGSEGLRFILAAMYLNGSLGGLAGLIAALL